MPSLRFTMCCDGNSYSFFWSEKDYRISLLKDVGLKINMVLVGNRNDSLKSFNEDIEWNPELIDFEEDKDRIIGSFKKDGE
ncbi:MAG: hypothetical protein AAGU19_01880 [Prolixibacteraceae bacterium]